MVHVDPMNDFITRRVALVHAAGILERLLGSLLDVEGINYLSVTARAKEIDSFGKKAFKLKPDGERKYVDPINEITDLLGARIITFIPDTVDRACTLIRDNFVVIEEIDKGALTKEAGQFGYASRHFVVQLDSKRNDLPENATVRNVKFEIQVRTVVQHAWAEFEHDVRYHYDIPAELRPRFDRSFALSAALLEMADREFSEIDKLFQELAQATPTPLAEETSTGADVLSAAQQSAKAIPAPLTATDLPRILSKRYPDAPRSKRDHYEWVVHVLRHLDISTVDDLDKVLGRVDSRAVANAMNHQLPAGQVRRLDDDLLASIGPRYERASLQFGDRVNRGEILRKRAVRLEAAGVRARA